MNSGDGAVPTVSDQVLVEQTREGDQRAFAELWRRHFRSGARVARQFTSSIDSDDLVSEAYTRIYQRVLAGGGPTGAFRPYLYTTIRNLASTWGAASRDVQVGDIADFEDPASIDDPAAIALDRTLTARAFRSLPERWQSVLWYTEVEGMDPHEVAPVLGMTANGVAALSYRAREGLRKAWLQAHINDATASGECQWTISRIGEHARKGLTTRDTDRVDAHLMTCAKCAIINEEVDEVGSRLALVMLPILLGGVAGGAMLASYGGAGSAMAASVGAIPAVPAVFGSGAAISSAATTTAALGFFGIAGASISVVGTLAVAVFVSGFAVSLAPLGFGVGDTARTSVSEVDESAAAVSGSGSGSAENPGTPADDTIRLGSAISEAVTNSLGSRLDSGVTDGPGTVFGGVDQPLKGDLGGAVGGVTGVVGPVTGDAVVADLSLNLAGTATPGAQLTLQAAGQVYATTTVGAAGGWVLNEVKIPGAVSSLDLVQQVDRAYLNSTLPGGGVLATVLGTADGLVDALVRPLQLSSGGSGVTINLIG